MGKKKGKKSEESAEEGAGGREFSHNYEEGGEASADASQPAAETVDVSDTSAPAPAPKSSGSGGDVAMDLSDTLVVRGTSETRHIKSVPYCEVCSMPFEFCEWNPLFSKCKENFEKNWRKYFPEVDESEEGLADLMSQLGFSGGDAASKKAQTSKKAAAADGEGAPQPTSKKDKKAKEPSEVVIELNNRNKKKHITIVKGLEAFGVDTAAAAKVFGKRFACGSALKKGQNGQPDQIEIQGSCRDELPSVLVDKLKMSIDDIVLLIDGKKVKASEAAK